MKLNNEVAIIILNWNGLKDTRNCLRSLLKLKDKNFTIFVVDNGSNNNEAKKIAQEFRSVEVIPLKENLGFTGGVNVGIDYASKKITPDFYLLLNNDTEVNPLFLQQLLKGIQKFNAGLAAPVIYDYKDRKKIWFGGGKINWVFAKPFHVTDSTQINFSEQEYLTGCALLIKKEVIAKVGVLDNTFFAYFEDAAYSLLARKNGYRCLLVPSAKVYHIQAASTGKTSSFNTYLVSRNRILFAKKYGPWFLQPYFLLFFVIKLCAVSVYFFFTNQSNRLKAYASGFFDGITNKGGSPV